MAIITISRGTFSGGKALGERLAERLGYPLIDRDTLMRRGATERVSPYDLRAALEFPPVYPGRFNHTRHIYLALIRAALAQEVRSGRAVYHGLAGHLLLKGAPGLLRLRIIAPIEARIRAAQEQLHFSRGEAIWHIDSMDRDRRKWTQFLYGLDWGDPSLYDLVMNLEKTSVDQACLAVAELIESGAFAITEEDRMALDDLAVACGVRAALARDPHTVNLEVKVESHRGAVFIQSENPEEFRAVERVALKVAGVCSVRIETPAAIG